MISILLDIFVIALVLGGVQMYIDAHVGIDTLTQKIKTPWLRTTIRILLKVGAATVIVAGVVCTIICMVAIMSEPKKGKGK